MEAWMSGALRGQVPRLKGWGVQVAKRCAAWVRLRRHRLPGPVQSLLTWLRWCVPQRWVSRLHPIARVADPADLLETPRPFVPASAVRLFIAPANYAGQGFLWARAATTHIDSVHSVSSSSLDDRGISFTVDYRVPAKTYETDKRWQSDQWTWVVEQFTHVLAEAARPLFGSLFGRDLIRELDALERAGLGVAMIAHGTDARLPSRHAESDEWSPFRDRDWSELPLLQFRAERSLAAYARFGGPIFVSTPDLLADLPTAAWCPVVVDPARWRQTEPAQSARPLRVVHAPSRSHIKGSTLIDPVLTRLQDQGVIDYTRIEGVPAQEMPNIYRSADIVLDQFRLGSYGVSACEAMAAGRVVIGHVSSEVREYVHRETARVLPIIEATPRTLEDVIRAIADDRSRARSTAAAGVEFVSAVHDGERSARALATWLLQGPGDS